MVPRLFFLSSRRWNHGHDVGEVKSERFSARKLPLRWSTCNAAVAVVRTAAVGSGPARAVGSGLATSAERISRLARFSWQFLAVVARRRRRSCRSSRSGRSSGSMGSSGSRQCGRLRLAALLLAPTLEMGQKTVDFPRPPAVRKRSKKMRLLVQT